MSAGGAGSSVGEKVMASLGGIGFGLILLVGSTIFTGFAISVLWMWFVVPVLHVGTLSVMQAYGVSLAGQALIGAQRQYKPKMTPEEKRLDELTALVILVLRPAFFLAIGWIVKHWV